MATDSQHLSVHIARPVDEVYEFAADPGNLPSWAAGLASAAVEQVDGQWFVDSPMGRVRLDFAPHNEFGVLDHYVTLPSGETNYNPVRVIADGGGSEVVFSLRRQPGVSDEDLARDVEAVSTDLATLKKLLEG